MFKQKFIRPIHLFLGLLSGLVVFTVAITGSIYAFEQEIRNVVYADMLFVKQSDLPTKPIHELLENVKQEYPDSKVKNIKIKSDKGSSIEITLKNKQSVFLNPYTGKFLGSFNRDEDFFGVVLRIHRRLCLGDTGKLITGTSALIFLVMLISGIILWWPKNKGDVQKKLTIYKTVHLQKRLLNIHSVLGFYASWVLVFSALTGLIFAFDWAENSLYFLSNSKKENLKNIHSTYVAGASKFDIDQIINQTNASFPKSKECFVMMPDDSIAPVKISLRYDRSVLYKKQDQLFFDQYSGQLIKEKLFVKNSTGEKLKATNYDIHTGKVLGLTGQFLIFFAGLIAASLPVTGFWMWWRKRKLIA